MTEVRTTKSGISFEIFMAFIGSIIQICIIKQTLLLDTLISLQIAHPETQRAQFNG